jgi:uncharacterized protein YgfB (UPF0149 family)
MKFRFAFTLSDGSQMFHDAKTLAACNKWIKGMGWVATNVRQLSKYPVV